MPVKRAAYGITYYAYSLHDWRALRTPHDIPRDHWPILQRSGWPASGSNYEPANRIDNRVGAIPQLGGVDHIGAGFQDNTTADLGAERLTEYGLSPGNSRASWNAAVDSNTICLLAPPDTRPWQHGVSGSPYDLNSYGLGVEDGILSTNWDALPEPKRTAHLRMRAAWWALWMGYLGWPLKYTDSAAGVWDHIRRGESWGLTQHGIVDPANRTDAGLVYRGGKRVNTFPYDELFRMIREEQAIRTSGGTTPGLPADNEGFTTEHIKHVQTLINEIGAWGVLDVDGSLGPLTKTAVEAAQADLGITVDGLPGDETTTALEDTMSTLPERTAAAVWGQILARPGESDPTVRADTLLRYAANRAQAQAALDLLTQLASREGVDPEAVGRAIADSLREDVVAAVREAGSLADPEAVVDALAARLTPTPAPEQEQS